VGLAAVVGVLEQHEVEVVDMVALQHVHGAGVESGVAHEHGFAEEVLGAVVFAFGEFEQVPVPEVGLGVGKGDEVVAGVGEDVAVAIVVARPGPGAGSGVVLEVGVGQAGDGAEAVVAA